MAEADATASGEEAYREACAECHRSPERLVRGMRGDESERRERLEAFLIDHHAPDEGMRQSVIAYLLSL
ncbi:hypothetical protein N177_2231 [Lutibaculum baratangense AMV1]|uniref:Cytochrome c domain-containing protein n=1 Tax=Lutibaculum baratangense AMV1 TaxID=631454 RepID=V4TFK4_9HYPH|nr:hypothetical protein N177_2231 [Lutibaculum baratangense AMV1]